MLTEGKRTAEFLLSEGNGMISRDTITVAAGQNLVPGAVLGKVTATGKHAAYNSGATDGTEIAVGVLYAGVDATAADADGVMISRLAEVAKSDLTGLDVPSEGHLLALNIIAR